MTLEERGMDHLIDEDKAIIRSQKYTVYILLNSIKNIKLHPDGA